MNRIEVETNVTEVWKDVEGFPYYKISNKGRLVRESYVSSTGKKIAKYFPKKKDKKNSEGVTEFYYSLCKNLNLPTEEQERVQINVEVLVGKAFLDSNSEKFSLIDRTLPINDLFVSNNIVIDDTLGLKSTAVLLSTVYIVHLDNNNKDSIGNFDGETFDRVKYFPNKERLKEEFSLDSSNIETLPLTRNLIVKYNLFFEVGREIKRFQFTGDELKKMFHDIYKNTDESYEYHELSYRMYHSYCVESTSKNGFYKRFPLTDNKVYFSEMKDFSGRKGYKVYPFGNHKKVGEKNEVEEEVFYLVHPTKGFLFSSKYEEGFQFVNQFERATQFKENSFNVVKALMKASDSQIRKLPFKDSIFAKFESAERIIESPIKVTDDEKFGIKPSFQEEAFLNDVAKLIKSKYFSFSGEINVTINDFKKSFRKEEKKKKKEA